MRAAPRLGVVLALVAAALLLVAAPADAHVTTVAYADLTAANPTDVRVEFDLQYELLSASAAKAQNDPSLFEQAVGDPQPGAENQVLADHAAAILAYTTARFTVSAEDGTPCRPQPDGPAGFHNRDATDYARFAVRYVCGSAHGGAYLVRSALFPDSEGQVKDTKTIVTYTLDGRRGSAALDAAHPQFSTAQPWTDRFAEFFLLGAEHLLTGLDHILFLVALIVGSRRLRDVVFAATAFTVAHSVTFLLAALGLVHVPSRVVEPAIALSIAAVAGWFLWTARRRTPTQVLDPTRPAGPRIPSRAATAVRLGIVFSFGLVHGLGFASALNIQEPWSWTLLWSLLVFNLGIEAVQLAIIAILFPPLSLLRRRAPRTATVLSVIVAAVVLVFGLVWLVQRALGLG
ncbi:HupE/UreJ family protein [Microbacterium capsulatum]|uniref:HupE/UreJ family protein n=1 Tax=Microbacterium capsulatum TaxID=3041921 RepID=A0ABU0XHR1_9MICO|nr:HupE/UreJ family protein [Microbacterium sp. ASV81]MDQ4214679.1 HupE/UreJ family protein [Microbacterium sp. ASV81]